jgi:hypothetical protein
MQKRFTLNDAVPNCCSTAARVAGYDYFAFCSPGVPLRSTPGFMQSSASRTDFASMIRQVCDYPKEPLAKLDFFSCGSSAFLSVSAVKNGRE